MRNYPDGMSRRDLMYVGELDDGLGDYQCVECEEYIDEEEVVDVNGAEWCRCCVEARECPQCPTCKKLFANDEALETHVEETHAPLG